MRPWAGSLASAMGELTDPQRRQRRDYTLGLFFILCVRPHPTHPAIPRADLHGALAMAVMAESPQRAANTGAGSPLHAAPPRN